MLKINLGSHNKRIEGYINFDILDLENVDAFLNIEEIPFSPKIKSSKMFQGTDWDFLFENNLNGQDSFIMPDSFIDEVLCDEVLEHISFRKTDIVLREIYRILKYRGVLKLQVPDCGKTMEAYVNKQVCNCVPHKVKDGQEMKADSNCLICGGKAIMDWDRFRFAFMGAQKHQYDFHKALFTKDILEKELHKAGFNKIEFLNNPVKLKVIATKI
jgi:hypothetical protein